MAERNPPSWTQGGSHSAENDRAFMAAMVQAEGVAGPGDLRVSFTSGLGLSIAAGTCWVQTDSAALANMYHCVNDANLAKTLSSNGSGNPRKSIVVAKVNDNFYDGSGLNTWTITLVDGTPAATPVDPATPTNSLKLASITVPSNNVISQNSIVDVRPRARVNGEPPVSTLMPYAGLVASVPGSWLIANGAAVSRAIYKHLFDAMGTTYGNGDGSTTFNLPDMRGRVPVCQDDMGGVDAGRLDSSGTSLGSGAGSQYRTITQDQLPLHRHRAPSWDTGGRFIIGGLGNSNAGLSVSSGGTNEDNTGFNLSGPSSNVDSNDLSNEDPLSVMQPYLVVNYIIKV